MKARTLRHIVCGLTITGAIFAGLFPDQTYGAPPTSSACAGPTPGTAPVTTPAGGFGIDANLQANTPTAGIGDWLPTPSGGSGSGGFVINNNGTPVNGTTTFNLVDAFGSNGDNNFTGGRKVDQNPNTDWAWTFNPVNGKQDINHALVHITTTANGHTWVFVSGDRFSNNGNAYIDFEFLQKSLTLTTNAAGTGGNFVSAGTDCGRTVNDFLLTISFTNGGTQPGVCFSRWMASGSNACGFDYIDQTSLLPVGAVFAAVNGSSIPVPFTAFGKNTYDANTFVEAAVDLTALFANIDPCLGVQVDTLFVKTKESQSSSATITDFISPQKLTLQIGPTADAGDDQTKCSEGDSTTFTVNGTATGGINPITSTTWSVVPNSGSATIDSPSSLSTSVHVTSASVTLRLTVVAGNCTKTDDVVLTVNNSPTCSISSGSQNSLCPNVSGNTYSGPAGAKTYAWSIIGNGTIVGSTTGQSVTVTNGSACNSSFTLTLEVTDANGCKSSCDKTVLVNDTTAPVITCPANKVLACGDSTDPSNTGIATATDNCPGAVTITHSDAATANCTGQPGVDRTWTATDGCGKTASCVQHITFADATPPTFTVPAGGDLGCNPTALPTDSSVKAQVTNAMDNCGGTPTINVGHTDSTSGCMTTRTFSVTATDNCMNTSQAKTVVYTWTTDTAAPMITLSDGKACGGSESRMCTTTPPTFPTATANDACNGDLGTPVNLTGQPVPTTRPLFYFVDDSPSPGTFRRTWTAIDSCGGTGKGNSASCSFTITCQPCAPLSDCTPPYPFASSNPRTNIAFNESEVLRAFGVSLDQTGCTPTMIQLFYNDEHALTLGIRRVIVKQKTAPTTTTTDYTVTPLPTPPPGSATDPSVGCPTCTGDQADVDVSGRPIFPALFITDVTNDPNSLAGDWQSGGTGIPPHAVFGTWKAAVKTVDKTKTPNVTTVTPDADPAKNNWNLGPGSDTPTGGFAALKNEGYGAEARWDISRLTYQACPTCTPAPLMSGHKYRMYFMVHDGDQNKAGGDSGQDCVYLTIP